MSDKTPPTDHIVTFLRKRDYKLIRELGKGACGQTVLLHDDQIDEKFVCKKYFPYSESARSELFANFVREIKLLHQIHHPNVVRVFNYYVYPDHQTGYILMEFVDGSDVENYVESNPERINDVFLQTVSGFAYLEKTGVLHRDIRPMNLMVTNEGVVKIIDLGFGKQVSSSRDFDKSISLNLWCPPPDEFRTSRYDFATEVYFVGQLFERMLRNNGISSFHYAGALRSMCARDPAQRVASFTAVLKDIRNEQFSEIRFSPDEQASYRRFADEVRSHVTKIEQGARYYDDIAKMERQLREVFHKVMLEDELPDCAPVLRCVIDGTYYYTKTGFPVLALRSFADLLRSCSPEQGKILLANLHTRLDAVPRYAPERYDDDIPF